MRSSPDRRELQRIYDARFAGKTGYRNRIWRELALYFSQWFPSTGTALDLGAGYCEFIDNVTAGRKYAMDLNPEVHARAGQDVTVLQQHCAENWQLPEGGTGCGLHQ